MKQKIKLICVILIPIILISVSCADQNDQEVNKTVSVTTQIINENVKFLNDEPLYILYKYYSNWGVNAGDATGSMWVNLITLSNLCKEKFGFPLKFVGVNERLDEDNIYATYIRSGQKGDLIFPSPVKAGALDSWDDLYWRDSFIQEGIYMDLTSYIERFCPEAILNFERYPYIKEMFTKEGKTYAIYAGMPDINKLALIVKNKLLEETDTDINDLNNFEPLYEFMDHLYQGDELPSDDNKIMVQTLDLLRYSIYDSGYYPLRQDMLDVVFKMNDERCTPYPIEKTDIFDRFMDKFSKFFAHSYFTDEYLAIFITPFKDNDLFLTRNALLHIKRQSKFCTNETDNFFTNHSIVLFEEPNILVNNIDTILPIILPATSTQPEKALIFMQWLMTDKDAADRLTFGSRLMSSNHYRYANDGTIIPEKYNTIYGFYNLISNFLEKAFLCGNKDFNIIHQYKELTYQAEYPILIKKIDAQNSHYSTLEQFTEIHSYIKMTKDKRYLYLQNSIKELVKNPYSHINADLMASELFVLEDTENIIEQYTEFVRKILESGDIIYGN